MTINHLSTLVFSSDPMVSRGRRQQHRYFVFIVTAGNLLIVHCNNTCTAFSRFSCKLYVLQLYCLVEQTEIILKLKRQTACPAHTRTLRRDQRLYACSYNTPKRWRCQSSSNVNNDPVNLFLQCTSCVIIQSLAPHTHSSTSTASTLHLHHSSKTTTNHQYLLSFLIILILRIGITNNKKSNQSSYTQRCYNWHCQY